MRIFITGAGGYLGAKISKFLADQGHQVIALCYSCVPKDAQWVASMEEVLVGDVRDEKLIKEVADKKIDLVINLVSLNHSQSNTEPSLVSSVNVMPTWNLLDIFSKKGLKQFVYFSTVQVYGNLNSIKEAITEEYDTHCGNFYSLTHLLSEKICEYYSTNSDVKCSVLRLSNSYGSPFFMDNNCWSLVINDLCRSAYLNKKIELASDGSPVRDFIHINDVCLAVNTIIHSRDSGTSGSEVYNVSSGNTMSILEVAGIVKNEYNKRYGANLAITTTNGISTDDNVFKNNKNSIVSNQKLKNLNFEQPVSLADGINDLFTFLEKNNGK